MEVVDKTKCNLVITSDWRERDSLIDVMLGALEEGGIPRSVVIGRTELLLDTTRARKIERWLDEHGKLIGNNWAAVDDLPLEAMERPGGRMKGHCVQIDPSQGITDQNVGDIITTLLFNR